MDNKELTDLINRLLCRYPIGPIDPSTGEPEFGWRDYSGSAPEDMVIPSPPMIEAARDGWETRKEGWVCPACKIKPSSLKD